MSDLLLELQFSESFLHPRKDHPKALLNVDCFQRLDPTLKAELGEVRDGVGVQPSVVGAIERKRNLTTSLLFLKQCFDRGLVFGGKLADHVGNGALVYLINVEPQCSGSTHYGCGGSRPETDPALGAQDKGLDTIWQFARRFNRRNDTNAGVRVLDLRD